MKPLRALLSLVIASVAFTAGCFRIVNEPPEPGETIAISPVALQRDTGDFVIEARDLDSIARQADVAPDDVKALGILPGKYRKPDVVGMLGKLRTENEQYFLMLFNQSRLGAPEPTAPGYASPAPPPAPPRASPPATPVALPGPLPPPPPPTPLPAPDPTSPSLANLRALFNYARTVFKDEDITVDRMWAKREQALRTVAAKDAGRQWLLARLANHRFEGALSVTLEVVSSSQSPILLGERAFVSMGGKNRLALTRRNRDCNEQRNSCRYEYAHFSSESSAAWTALLNGAKAKQDTEDTASDGKPTSSVTCLRGICPAITELQIELLVAGRVVTRPLPLAFMTVVDKVEEGASPATVDAPTDGPAL